MDKLRGHAIVFINGEWLYEDTRTPTVGNARACGFCGRPNTVEGYDGCLGYIPGAMNACCGHGTANEAYIQYPATKRWLFWAVYYASLFGLLFWLSADILINPQLGGYHVSTY